MIDSIPLTGKSSNFYMFEIISFDDLEKYSEGVYIIYSDYNKIPESLIYIGETEQKLSERFDNHHKEGCVSKINNRQIAFHKTSTKKERIDLETDLLLKHNTPCNEMLN